MGVPLYQLFYQGNGSSQAAGYSSPRKIRLPRSGASRVNGAASSIEFAACLGKWKRAIRKLLLGVAVKLARKT